MAQGRRTTQKYVYDIPYMERMELCRILDQNDKWEELGGIHMNFDMLTIQTLRREILRGNSPTDELLTRWGHQNHTILELFVLLSKMQHYQAMLIIKQFVDPEYHRLIYEGEQNLHRIFKEKPTSKLNFSDAIHQPTSQTSKVREKVGTRENQDISQNLDFPKPQNSIKDKDAFLNYNLNGKVEKKILNQLVPSDTAGNSNNNRNNAQTALMNKMDNIVGNDEKAKSSKFHKHESGKDSSEMTSIAETVGILPVITFKELELATNGWDHNTILGKGGFGTVYKGIWKNTPVAIKRTRSSETNENHSVQIQQILGELKMLNSYRHDNILPLYGFSIDGEDPCLIYQFMPNGSLEDRLLCRQGTKPLSWHQRHNIAIGTARGIQFLHTIGEKPLIHGDIKSANILLDSNFEPKIGDFGLAREGPYNHYTHMKVSRVHGTRPYLPDEFLRHKKFSTKVDTHSFGIVLFELATGLRAYDDQRHHKFLKDLVENTQPGQLTVLIDKKCGPDEHQTFPNLIELGKCCVAKKPKDRPEMVIVLQELNVMAVKRDMMVKVQSMIRHNSLIPSTPFEMQVLYDNLSQQKKMSPSCSTANHFRAPTRAISPLQPYHDPNVFNNAASIEAQMVNGHTNNPFLNADFLKENEKKLKDKLPYAVINDEKEDIENLKDTLKNVGLPGPVTKEKVEVKDVSRTPVISVCPPSASQSSSVSSEDKMSSPQEESQQEALDYEFTSDVENFLPLISVLGVKGKSEQAKESEEPMERNDSQDTTVRPVDINTSAKGKPLWILHDERGFSAVTNLLIEKKKQTGHHQPRDLRLSLTKLTPNVDNLLLKPLVQPSH